MPSNPKTLLVVYSLDQEWPWTAHTGVIDVMYWHPDWRQHYDYADTSDSYMLVLGPYPWEQVEDA